MTGVRKLEFSSLGLGRGWGVVEVRGEVRAAVLQPSAFTVPGGKVPDLGFKADAVGIGKRGMCNLTTPSGWSPGLRLNLCEGKVLHGVSE